MWRSPFVSSQAPSSCGFIKQSLPKKIASKAKGDGYPSRGSFWTVYRLDSEAGFYLNRTVSPAEDAGQEGGTPFTTTHWSVVLEAQGDSPAAQVALERLCRIYWRPIYSFVRRQGVGPEKAEDLTQGFFALLLERKDLNTVRKEKGRLRSYLIASLKNFLADESRHAMAIKRGKG